jgi:hypothetical protein
MSDRETPWERWSRDVRPLQHLTEDELACAFVTHLERTVTSDRLVSIEGLLYEIPRDAGRGGQKILVTHRLLEGTYHVLVRDRLVRIHPVDLATNARSPRTRPNSEDDEPKPPPEPTAADLRFERDLGPVVDDEGGALPPPHPPEEAETT